MTLFKKIIIFSLLGMNIHSRDFFIYSVEHDLPMGYENEVLRKNYYLNIGSQQGITKGTTLDVYRSISQNDPFETKKRYNYKVKIGELEVIHQDDEASIAIPKILETGEQSPILEVSNFMVGDNIKIKLK